MAESNCGGRGQGGLGLLLEGGEQVDVQRRGNEEANDSRGGVG